MKAFSSSSRGVLWWTLVGFVALNCWFHIVGYSGAFSTQDDSLTTLMVGRYGFFLSSLIFIVLFALFDWVVQRFESGFKVASPLLLFIGTGMFGLSTSQTLMDPTVFIVVGCIVIGFGYSWYLLNLYQLLGGNGTIGELAVFFIVSRALSTLFFSMMTNFLSETSQVIFSTCLAFVIVISLVLAQRGEKKNAKGDDRKAKESVEDESFVPQAIEGDRHLRFLEWKQILQMIFITVAMLALRGLGQGGIWGDSRSGQEGSGLEALGATFATLGVFVVIASISFWLYTAKPWGYRDKLPMLILIAGLLVMVGFEVASVSGFVAHIFTSAVELYCQTLFSFAVVMGIRILPFSAFKVSGFILGLSYVLAMVWMFFFEGSGMVASLFLLAVSYLLVITVAIPSKVEKGSMLFEELYDTTPTSEMDLYEAVVQRGEQLAHEHGLTNRETEILQLLLQGRSLPFIQDELVLASGTVRTHVMRIYKKLDIHSRQELLNLLASGEN